MDYALCAFRDVNLPSLPFRGKAKTGMHGLPMWLSRLRRIIKAYSFSLTSMSYRDLPLL